MNEIIFLVGFIIFIAAILVLDMLVIDRKAHVVSIKEAGTWTGVWIGLALLFSIFLWFHGDMVHGIDNMQDLQAVASRYASHLKLNPNDFEASLQQYRHYMTISYIPACAQLGHTGCHRTPLHLHLPRRSHHQPFRLDTARIRCDAGI